MKTGFKLSDRFWVAEMILFIVVMIAVLPEGFNSFWFLVLVILFTHIMADSNGWLDG